MAKYLILLYDNETAWEHADEAATDELMAGHDAFGTAAGDKVLGGNGLQATTTAISIRPAGDGTFVVTDGPFVETKEALGGYYLVEAADLGEAIALAEAVPTIEGGAEIRPVMVFG